jgi:hypothetical protein
MLLGVPSSPESAENSALARAHGYAEQRINMHGSHDRQVHLAIGLRQPRRLSRNVLARPDRLFAPVEPMLTRGGGAQIICYVRGESPGTGARAQQRDAKFGAVVADLVAMPGGGEQA